jgi:hypothetical protein
VDATTVAALGAAGVGAGGGSFEATASGSLSNGSAVIVNTDGTVSTIAGVNETKGTTVQYTAVNAHSGQGIDIAFDDNANKVLVVYADSANSNQLTGRVGTVGSGATISWGTAVVLDSSSSTQYVALAYSPDDNKFMVCYKTGSGGPSLRVLTISGTSVSAGSRTNVSNDTDWLDIVYDKLNNTFVIMYEEANTGYAFCADVSGTSITTGSLHQFESGTYLGYFQSVYHDTEDKIVAMYERSGTIYYNILYTTNSTTVTSTGPTTVAGGAVVGYDLDIVYNPDLEQIIMAYRNAAGGGGDNGTLIVGTLNTLTMTFGNTVTFNTGYTHQNRIMYDPAAENVFIMYCDNPQGNKAGYIKATPGSGNTITVDTAGGTLFTTSPAYQYRMAYDTSNNAIVAVYRLAGGNDIGESFVFLNTTSNANSGNFVGFSDAAYTNGQTATILTAGTVATNQTGLTAGNKYYLQADGSIATSVGTLNTVAGKAIAPTKLLITL